MNPAAGVSRLLALAREHPVWAALELATLLSCLLLLVGTMVALVAYPPTEATGVWLGIVVLGGAVVLLWTVVVPLYERLVLGSSA